MLVAVKQRKARGKMSYVPAERREVVLKPIPAKFSKVGGYMGKIAGRRVIPYGDVLDEIIGNGLLGLDRMTLNLVLIRTFETMIENTLKDGNSRRLGNYFTLQVEVKGRFEEPGDQFDPSQHKLALTLRPLSGILDRQPDRRNGLTVYNRNSGPAVKVTRMYSVNHPDQKGIVYGEDLVIEGENLFFDAKTLTDTISVKYFSKFQHGVICSFISGHDVKVSADGKRIDLSWEQVMGKYLSISERNARLFDPATNPPVAMMLGIRSRGGDTTSKRQLHRARAYFDTWLALYPDSNVHSTIWGRI